MVFLVTRPLRAQLGLPALPAELPADYAQQPALLAQLHTVLLDVSRRAGGEERVWGSASRTTRTCLRVQTHIMEGQLVCPKCARVYAIQRGVPNMRLNENEV